MVKAVKGARFKSVKIKVLRRSITGPAKVSYLYQGLPEPNCKVTHPSDPQKTFTPQQAEPDDVVPSCSSCSETAYSKAKKIELHAWNAVKDDMLKVSFEGMGSGQQQQTAFSIPLQELFVCLSLECQVSVERFCNTLRWKNNLTLAEVSQFAEDCSNFKAGNVLRSPQHTKKLDVTGVFGASCRHEMALISSTAPDGPMGLGSQTGKEWKGCGLSSEDLPE
ncbi:hypothetical protein E1301_Tti021658 [Triplophysa tibetana]|uniref:Uncharacterized protein n=1 Tax=Triplophysa tibetana TaxID=1572043 RepID=A0A5A9PQA5_9TELE|nr:hypothetical protein E1301_Tti021658 [Triplophysa tibetana]